MKVGYGEIDYPDGNGSQAYLRNAFLHTIEQHNQTVLKDLYEILPLYLALGSEDQEIIRYIVRYPRTEQVAIYVKAIDVWTCKYNLNASWVFEIVLYTLQTWSHYSKVPGQLFFTGEGWGGPGIDIPPFFEGTPAYRPTGLHQREGYLLHIRSLAHQEIEASPLLRLSKASKVRALVDSLVKIIKERCIEAENQFYQAGFLPTETKRELPKHLLWTVRFQVCNENYTGIAREGDAEVSSVKRAIEDILQAIDLKRRDIRSGRPKGRKDSPNTLRRRAR